MFGLIGFFIPIVEALVIGYFAIIASYMAALFVVTRLGRPVLMQGQCASAAYTVLHMLAWGIAAAAGAYICCSLSPLPPYGNVGFPVLLALIGIYVALRSFRQLPGQMSTAAFTGNVVMILAGTAAALVAHHALPIHS